MADRDDEIDFSDTALEDLPLSTLQDLEHTAISSTQRQLTALRSKHYTQVARPFKLSLPSTTWQQALPDHSAAPAPPDPPSSDYGFDDEDVIDLDEPPVLAHPAPAPPHAVAADHINRPVAAINPGLDHVTQSVTNNVLHLHDSRLPGPAQDLAALNAKTEALEREVATLRVSLKTAEAAAVRKAGENAILRAKNEKETKEHERQMAEAEKKHADDSARHRLDAQAALKDRETIETNNRFLEHDLAQELQRRKRSRPAKPSVNQPSRNGSALPSPAKMAATSYRDGFDDHEIVFISPSKPKDKPKPETPKVGDKRKRNLDPSPVAPPLLLETTASKTPPSLGIAEESEPLDGSLSARNTMDKSSFRIMQQVITHHSPNAGERTLEVLTNHTLPSESETSVAALIIDALTRYDPAKEQADLSLYVCNTLLDLWHKSLVDSYYASLDPLVDLLQYVLALGPRAAANQLIERFVPLVIKSIDLIAWPLALSSEQASTLKTQVAKPEPSPALSEQINVNRLLIMMHEAAMTASLSSDTNRAFWQKMEFDFTLMMLNIPQQLPHMQLMLQMVGTSVLPDSFGVIPQQPERQTSLETHTIDRLTNLLFEQPKAPVGQPSYKETELAALRIETIRTLGVIGSTERGSVSLAQHRTAIGRLLRFLHNQITSLYDLPTGPVTDLDDGLAEGSSDIHRLTTSLINMTIRLVYRLLHDHADLITLRDKLAVIPGGHHKFIVALTRLAFSEQLVYEAGIDEEAVDAAHEILDHILTPEEGDAIVEAIEPPRGSNTTRASASG